MGVFEPPTAVGLAFKMQGRWKFFAGQRGRQVKPEKPDWPRSMPAETHLTRRKLDEPSVRRGLRGDHGHGRFVELKQMLPFRIVGEHEVAGDFGHSPSRPPYRLADLDFPTGARCCEETFGARLAAAKKREADQQN